MTKQPPPPSRGALCKRLPRCASGSPASLHCRRGFTDWSRGCLGCTLASKGRDSIAFRLQQLLQSEQRALRDAETSLLHAFEEKALALKTDILQENQQRQGQEASIVHYCEVEIPKFREALQAEVREREAMESRIVGEVAEQMQRLQNLIQQEKEASKAPVGEGGWGNAAGAVSGGSWRRHNDSQKIIVVYLSPQADSWPLFRLSRSRLRGGAWKTANRGGWPRSLGLLYRYPGRKKSARPLHWQNQDENWGDREWVEEFGDTASAKCHHRAKVLQSAEHRKLHSVIDTRHLVRLGFLGSAPVYERQSLYDKKGAGEGALRPLTAPPFPPQTGASFPLCLAALKAFLQQHTQDPKKKGLRNIKELHYYPGEPLKGFAFRGLQEQSSDRRPITKIASLLAGFASAALMQAAGVTPEYKRLHLLHVLATGGALGIMLLVLLISTFCSMWGPGLALRGCGAASVSKAVQVMDTAQQTTLRLFNWGLLCYVLSSVVSALLFQPPLCCLVLVVLFSISTLHIYMNQEEIKKALLPRALTRGVIRGNPLAKCVAPAESCSDATTECDVWFAPGCSHSNHIFPASSASSTMETLKLPGAFGERPSERGGEGPTVSRFPHVADAKADSHATRLSYGAFSQTTQESAAPRHHPQAAHQSGATEGEAGGFTFRQVARSAYASAVGGLEYFLGLEGEETRAVPVSYRDED
ncbi:hypothetical protein cyc_00152 [Cyclospora cayetanensis]|uniref:Transmembrane protein n=1 Tax=Cyclospora cayetanensis TaxID=88456 RepID=A0A1D3D0C6_9EIME|nr:hypothetical protein cyc_00152 [Cyclospora cayetanensis]